MFFGFFSILSFLEIFTLIFSNLIVNQGIGDQNLEKFGDFDFTIPSNTFKNDEDSSIFLSISPNEWISTEYFNPSSNIGFGIPQVLDFVVDGSYLYLMDIRFGLRILYSSDFSSQSFDYQGNLEIIGSRYDTAIFIDGDYAFFCVGGNTDTGNEGMKIVSIKDKKHPTLISELSFNPFCIAINTKVDVFVLGDFAYLSCSGYLHVVNITSKNNPTLVGSLDIPNSLGVYVREDLCYVNTQNGFHVVNVTNKTNPELVGENLVSNGYLEVDFDSDFAYAIRSSGGIKSFEILNISDPRSPLPVGKYILYGTLSRISVFEDIVLVSAFEGIHYFNVTDRSKPVLVSTTSISFATQCNSHSISMVSQNVGIVGCRALSFNFISLKNSSQVEFIALNFTSNHYLKQSQYIALDTDGGEEFVLYISDKFGKSIQAISVNNPQSPVALGTFENEIQDYSTAVQYRNHTVYLALDDDLLIYQRIFIEGGHNIRLEEIGRVNGISDGHGCIESILIDEEIRYAYIANCYGFSVVDLSNYTLVNVFINWDGGCFALDERYGFMCSSSGIEVYDLQYLQYPNLINTIDLECSVSDLYLPERDQIDKTSYLYVACGASGMKIVNVTNPLSHVLVSTYDTSNAKKIFVDGNIAVVSDLEVGIKVIDISIKVLPVIFAAFSIDDPHQPIIKDNFIYVVDEDMGVRIYELDLKLKGSESTFSHFCGETEIEVLAKDSPSNMISDSFTLSRATYCNGRGECKQNLKCDCENGFLGDFCNTWGCQAIDFKSTKTCGGHGSCREPNVCECEGMYSGAYCENNMAYYYVLSPALGFGGITFLIFSGVLCCSILFCCCLCFTALMICLCVSLGVILRQFRGLKKFSKLRDFEMLLKEQEMDDDISVAHIRFDKKLFEVEMNSIETISILGEGGSSSVVFKAKWSGKLVAFKCFRTRTIMNNQHSFDEFEREVEILSSISHPNIIRFFGACLKPPRVGILMEFCPKGEILEFIVDFRKKYSTEYPFYQKIQRICEVCSALEYLHGRSIIHRDLKCENVLISADSESKLMDFGLSRAVDDMNAQKTKRIGTGVYMSPEIVTSANYDEKCDVFSLSIMIYILLTEQSNPYSDFGTDLQIELRVANDSNFRPDLGKLELGEDRKKWIEELLQKCWSHKPEERFSCLKIREILLSNIGNLDSKEEEKEDDGVDIEPIEKKVLFLKTKDDFEQKKETRDYLDEIKELKERVEELEERLRKQKNDSEEGKE